MVFQRLSQDSGLICFIPCTRSAQKETLLFNVILGHSNWETTDSALACDSCRKRKKRCHHTEPDARSSTVSNHTHQSPVSTSPSTQAASTDPQLSRSSGVEGEQCHTETSPTTSIPVEKISQGTEPIETTGRSNEIQADAPESTTIPQNQEGRSSRFIGDLNPEGIFLAATSPNATRGVSNDSIGVW
jgi:hypothetical protein